MTIAHPFQNVWPDKVSSERLSLNLVFTDCQNLAMNFDLKRAEAACVRRRKEFPSGVSECTEKTTATWAGSDCYYYNGQIKFASLLVVRPFLTDGNEIKI